MSELYAIAYSPWSECARWALDHHRIAYREVAYVPMIGAPALRARLKRLRGRVTVPAYFDEHGAFDDSFAIAQHADAIGAGEPLFPAGVDDPAVAHWNEVAQPALASGRALATARVGADLDARRESLPRGLRNTPLARPMGALGVRFLEHKYHLDSATESQHRDLVRQALEGLRAGLSGGGYLLDRFSYADIVMAALMQFVAPVDDRYIRLGAASRRCWTDEELAAEFDDLVAWRDTLYARHRRAAGDPVARAG